VELILNWLWQGGIVAAATAGVLRAMSPARARTRYWTAWAACAAVLALPVLPLLWFAASPATSIISAGVPTVSMPDDWWTSPLVALGIWALWLAVQGLRVAVSTAALRRAKQECRPFPPHLEARLVHWTRLRAAGRRAHLVLSNRVTAGGVLGGTSPLIAVAPSLLDRLEEADLDRIVIHEWAHVQRRDDLAQLVQVLVRTVAGWHPAIWWLERQLHLEREVACDDVAVAVTGSAKDYAACLTTLAGHAIPAVPRLPVLAAVSRSGLRRRIVRILATRRAVAPPWWPTPVIGALSIGIVAVGVGHLRVVHTTLSMPHVAATSLILAADLSAPRAPTAIHAIPLGRRTDLAVPMRARPAAYAGFATDRPSDAGATAIATAPATDRAPSTIPETPLPLADGPLIAATTPAAAGTTAPFGPPGLPVSATASLALGSRMAHQNARAIWDVAADAGTAVGRRSEHAAAAAAQLFTRFGRAVSRSF